MLQSSAKAEAPIFVEGVAPDTNSIWISSNITHIWDFATNGAITEIEAQYGMDDEEEKKDQVKINHVKTTQNR